MEVEVERRMLVLLTVSVVAVMLLAVGYVPSPRVGGHPLSLSPANWKLTRYLGRDREWLEVLEAVGLRIIVPDHARRRSLQRGLPVTGRIAAGIRVLQTRKDVGNKEPLALLSEDGRKLVFEFRRRKSRAVVATVLGPGQRPKPGTRRFALAGLVGGVA